jgi:hypothetical protein
MGEIREIGSKGIESQPRIMSLTIIEGLAGIAAPVLAGFCLALIGVIAQAPSQFRWPGATLIVLMTPIFCLLYAVRAGYLARAYLYGADALKEYFAENGISPELTKQALPRAQRRLLGGYKKASRLTLLAYGAGISALWVCIAMTVAPPASSTHEEAFRWTGFAIAIAASAGEVSVVVRRFWHAHTGKPWISLDKDVPS